MVLAIMATTLLFDTRTFDEKQVELSPEDLLEEQQPGKLCCAVCGLHVTDVDQVTKIEQKHIHLKRNPYGTQFRIGCYRNAVGCGHFGPFSQEHSWFTDFSWSVGLCLSCKTQLGWIFTGEGTFYGLIMDKLINCK